MKDKLVSVCIPTYNSALFLKETLDSIISQSYNYIEIIIGDNASNDCTIDIIKEFVEKDIRISYYVNQTNIGYSSNCNKLISLAKGDYIAIYHSDDIYDTDIIKKEVEYLNNNIDVLGVFTSFEKINDNGKIIANTKYPINSKHNTIKVNLNEYLKIVITQGGSCFCCPTSMIRKEVYHKLSGYDVNLKYIEDQDMWARILMIGPLVIINEKLIKYRIHVNQGSSIYLNREIDSISLPMKHAIDFINKNLQIKDFEIFINKSVAIESIFFSKLAAKKGDYKMFVNKLDYSKDKFNFGLTSKIGLIQNFPIPKFLYFIVKFLYK
jgi:glycosyltransferase involved in cell wall biosynthesis